MINNIHIASYLFSRTGVTQNFRKRSNPINLNEKLLNHICKSTEGKKDMVTNLNDATVLPWALSSNFRSGKIGNWKNEFTKENLINAKKLLGKSLIELKYEKDLDWKISIK